MSNIGKRLIQIPENVKISKSTVNEKQKKSIISFEGPLGKKYLEIPDKFDIFLTNDSISNSTFLKIKEKEHNGLEKKKDSSKKKVWGTFRSIVVNNIIGVSQGFQITLKIVGVGYRASLELLENDEIVKNSIKTQQQLIQNKNQQSIKNEKNEKKEQKKNLVLKLGFSHLVNLNVPKNIFVKCIKPTKILLRSNNLEELMQYAALIRSFKRPEPYKGKGILYKGEKIRKKEGKKK